MNIFSKTKIGIFTLLSLGSSSVFAGSDGHLPVSVPEPGTLALMGVGIAAAIYLGKKRNK